MPYYRPVQKDLCILVDYMYLSFCVYKNSLLCRSDALIANLLQR